VIQFFGMIRTDNISEIDSAVAQTVEATIDPEFVRDFARADEAAGVRERLRTGKNDPRRAQPGSPRRIPDLPN
jgi:hypothetical protein